MRDGDTVRVNSMDRQARSLADLLILVKEMTTHGVTVEFVKERLTFRPAGSHPYAELQMHVLVAVAQLERAIIRERQAEGIAKAMAAASNKCRKPALSAEQGDGAREADRRRSPKAAVA